jgi:hypothetical protein
MPTIQEKLSRVISDGASSENEKSIARKILSKLPKEIKINYINTPTKPYSKPSPPMETKTYNEVHKKYIQYPVKRSLRFLLVLLDRGVSVLLFRFFEMLGILSLMLSDAIEEHRDKRGFKNASMFDQKYTEKDLILLALAIPRGIKKSLPSMRAVPAFRMMSKRHIYKIIEIAKEPDKVMIHKRLISLDY